MMMIIQYLVGLVPILQRKQNGYAKQDGDQFSTTSVKLVLMLLVID